jgi:2-iminobutanoate/2-iminopropanoate deaminase
MSKIVKVDVQTAPKAVGPYSQAIIASGFVFCSGQIAINPVSGSVVDGGIREQARQVLENLKAVLAGAGVGLDRVIKTEIYLTNIADFTVVNEIYSEYFKTEPLPARVTVEVSKLPKNSLIEISCVAYKK